MLIQVLRWVLQIMAFCSAHHLAIFPRNCDLERSSSWCRVKFPVCWRTHTPAKQCPNKHTHTSVYSSAYCVRIARCFSPLCVAVAFVTLPTKDSSILICFFNVQLTLINHVSYCVCYKVLPRSPSEPSVCAQKVQGQSAAKIHSTPCRFSMLIKMLMTKVGFLLMLLYSIYVCIYYKENCYYIVYFTLAYKFSWVFCEFPCLTLRRIYWLGATAHCCEMLQCCHLPMTTVKGNEAWNLGSTVHFCYFLTSLHMLNLKKRNRYVSHLTILRAVEIVFG